MTCLEVLRVVSKRAGSCGGVVRELPGQDRCGFLGEPNMYWCRSDHGWLLPLSGATRISGKPKLPRNAS